MLSDFKKWWSSIDESDQSGLLTMGATGVGLSLLVVCIVVGQVLGF